MNPLPLSRTHVSRRSHGSHRMAEPVRHDKTARQLRLLSDALDSGRLGPVRRLVNTLAPAEIGNLLESLPPAKRQVVWGLVDAEDDGEVLVHVGDEVRESLLADMDADEIVAAVEDLDIDDLADLVDDLPDTVIDEVLKSMDRENRERLAQVLYYQKATAGRLLNPDVVTVLADRPEARRVGYRCVRTCRSRVVPYH